MPLESRPSGCWAPLLVAASLAGGCARPAAELEPAPQLPPSFPLPSPPPAPTLAPPTQAGPATAEIPDDCVFAAGTADRLDTATSLVRPWLESLHNVQTDPYSPYVLRVYVNGIRRDRSGQSPLMTLRYLPSDQIAEMYYADC